MAQRDAPQYTKLLLRRGYSTVYYARNNSCACEIILANEILTLLCLYLHLWSVGSGERPKMQGTSVFSTKFSYPDAGGGGESLIYHCMLSSPTKYFHFLPKSQESKQVTLSTDLMQKDSQITDLVAKNDNLLFGQGCWDGRYCFSVKSCPKTQTPENKITFS